MDQYTRYTPKQHADFVEYVEMMREQGEEPLTIEQHLEFSACFG